MELASLPGAGPSEPKLGSPGAVLPGTGSLEPELGLLIGARSLGLELDLRELVFPKLDLLPWSWASSSELDSASLRLGPGLGPPGLELDFGLAFLLDLELDLEPDSPGMELDSPGMELDSPGMELASPSLPESVATRA